MPPKAGMVGQEDKNKANRRPEEEMKGDGYTEAVGSTEA